MIEVLPDSRARETRGSILIDTPFGRLRHVPIFCANCGNGGPLVTEDCTFAFWLCGNCSPKWAPLVGTIAVPDELFFAKLRDAQLEKYGHLLPLEQLAEAVSDSTNILSKLAREAPGRN